MLGGVVRRGLNVRLGLQPWSDLIPLVTLRLLIFLQGPQGKPGLPGMPGSDGPPVSGSPPLNPNST